MTEAVDADRDGLISKAEFSSAFGRWFAEWNHNGDDSLEEPEVVEGFSRLLGPRQEPSRARRPTGSPRF
jgi:hypothetical protein